MAIEPVNIGMSGTTTGSWSNSRGMGVYRHNDIGKNSAQLPMGGVNGKSDKSGNSGEPSKISDGADSKRRFDSYECQTCENRRYQDGSDDSGVSFQTPTRIDPKSAAAAVRGHEQEHVVRNHAKAEAEGKEIVSQNVVLHTGICEECGKVYISGGTTTTTTRNADDSDKFYVGMERQEKGGILDIAV